MVTAATKLKDACSLEESLDKPSQDVKNRILLDFTNKGPYVKAVVFLVVMYSFSVYSFSCTVFLVVMYSCGFSGSHVQMSELNHKEG